MLKTVFEAYESLWFTVLCGDQVFEICLQICRWQFWYILCNTCQKHIFHPNEIFVQFCLKQIIQFFHCRQIEQIKSPLAEIRIIWIWILFSPDIPKNVVIILYQSPKSNECNDSSDLCHMSYVCHLVLICQILKYEYFLLFIFSYLKTG